MKDTFKNNSEINIGDIIQIQIGYSMLIPKFYRVVSRSGSKTVNLRELIQKTTSGDGWQGRCVPGDYFRNDVVISGRISKTGFLKVDGHYAWIWDGHEAYYDYMD